jgi:Ca2+-binding RTX toxin-like protein
VGKHIQSSNLNQTWNIGSSNEIWKLTTGATVTSGSDTAVLQGALQSDDKIIINGDVIANGFRAIDIAGNSNTLEFGHNASVSGGANVGVYGSGMGFLVENQGTIAAAVSGVNVLNASEVINGGTISADYAIFASNGVNVINSGGLDGSIHGIWARHNSGTMILNDETASITGDDSAIYLQDKGSAIIKNFGLISGAKAIVNEIADLTVINRGTINGDVELGGGNDLFDNRGGTLHGKIVGGDGSDTYFIDSAKTKIDEAGFNGFDVVKSGVTYKLGNNVEELHLLGKTDINGAGNALGNNIFGNAGDNVLRGLKGHDTLVTGSGHDVMIGGADQDIFHFDKGTGHDKVMDFTNGLDLISSDFVHTDMDVQNLIDHHAKVQGDDLLIHYGADTLLLKHADLGDIDGGDFFT